MPKNLINAFITNELVTKLVADFNAHRSDVRRFVINLTARQRRALLKLRPDADKVIALITRLAHEQGIDVKSNPVDEMAGALAAARSLQPLIGTAQAFAQTLSDMMRGNQSLAWTSATLYYTILKRMARHDPELAKQMEPLQGVFGKRSAPVKQKRSVERADRKAAKKTEEAAKAQRKADARRSAVQAQDEPNGDGGSGTTPTPPNNGTGK